MPVIAPPSSIYAPLPPPRAPRGAPDLYAITPGDALPHDPEALLARVRAAFEAGVRWVQVREKSLDARALHALVSKIVEAAVATESFVLVNDRADIAEAAGAHGVHLTETSIPVGMVRKHFPRLLVGASVHSMERAIEVAAEGADFVVFGPVFDTPSKRPFGAPRGLARLEAIAHAVTVPTIAIGGIGPDEVVPCLRAGARGVAGIRGLLGADDVSAAVGLYRKELASSASRFRVPGRFPPAAGA